MSDTPRRTIKSFILRQGRLTQGQQRALEQQWPTFGIDFDQQAINFESLFNNNNDTVLEIGFGNGESLATMAEQAPDLNFIGIEVHRPGVGHLLHIIDEKQLNNLRVMNHDAIEILEQQIPNDSLARVQLYFPDPWHKKKHNKRRIVQTGFLDLLAKKVKTNGHLHFATDWQPYAEHMLSTLSAHPLFENTDPANSYSEKPSYRPETKFERRGQRLGHGVWDLVFKRR